MDVLQETNFAVLAPHLEQVHRGDDKESHEEGSQLKAYSTVTPPQDINPTGSQECGRTSLNQSPPLLIAKTPEPNDDSSPHAVSLTSHTAEAVSPWSPSEDCGEKANFARMESGSVSALTGDCLLQQSRACLGCFIETKDTEVDQTEPGLGLSQDYDACPVADIAMQCMSSGDGLRYGDQLLSDQLLSYPAHKSEVSEKMDEDKSAADSDSEDPATKSIYEGLLLDKCNGDEALLANSNQDWGCFESFISESKIELLDLCSKNDLSVNLFSEEDVDNYMFDDEDEDSTLGSDVCSLKIRYESFQDNVREKTNAIQEETQFSFFPSVVAKKEGEFVRRGAEGPHVKGEVKVWPAGEKEDKTMCSSAEETPNVSPESSYLFDLNNSTEDSGEYSDDSSCTGSSLDTCPTKKKHRFLSRENSSSSSHLSYGLRSKRKVRYSEDYLYDVDSIENEKTEKSSEKRDKPPTGLKKEKDDDWCPKKRRKSSRKEPPVIIKYIIINRFKGEKNMLVKLGKIDTSETTVSLSKDLVHKYQKLAPLKAYWEKRQQEIRQRRLAAGDKHKRLNGCRRSLNSCPSKRKYRIANRVRIQRIHAVEPLPSPSHHKREGCAKDEPVSADSVTITTTTADCAARLDRGGFTEKSRSQERERIRGGNKNGKIRKFKSEARLLCMKMKGVQRETDEIAINLQEVGPAFPQQSLDVDHSVGSPQLCDGCPVNPPEKSSPSSCCPSGTLRQPVNTSLPVIPGGYLQTLLDASDSSSNNGVSYYPQHHSRQFPHEMSQEENQFSNLRPSQTCVLSPPSDSELQQSPSDQMEPNFSHTWQPRAEELSFTPGSAMIGAGYSSSMPLTVTNDMPGSGYSQVNMDDNRLLYDKSYLSEKPPEEESDILPGQVSSEDGNEQLCRVTINTDNGRLVSYDSVGSLSASSSNYSSLSLKPCEKDGEDGSENFLEHCSPKLVIQQSTEEITPLRESTDLLDISNFTPDKFRHSSVSEMSPPDTPSLSPQVMGPEMRECQGKVREGTLSATPGGKWDCHVSQPQNHEDRAINNQQFQFHAFACEDDTGLIDKAAGGGADGYDGARSIDRGAKGPKSKRKTNNKQTLGQGSADEQKKAKPPRAAKTPKNKTPRQNARASKKIKSLLDAKAAQGPNQSMLDLDGGGLAGMTDDWPLLGDHGGRWADGSTPNPGNDDQREFEEPSNILSNIVSGMAEVQRFMKVSIEPLWDPMSGLCQPQEANSLKTKTLKILAGTAPDVRKKAGYAASTGTGRGRKATGRGAKSQAKFLPSNPFFSPLTLDSNMFNKSTLTLPGICGPAHKKMYRHKTSAKFARDENNTVKKDSTKNVALASYEKRR
ncbi:neurite extension and migration factor-like [Osmerus eperlanus]|uniref:neurite extension and migration factor-like n=1 Tax=Osmerus eperlanus TaxID=29151 RepID=UPI002E106F56